jgi:hypothetical protein
MDAFGSRGYGLAHGFGRVGRLSGNLSGNAFVAMVESADFGNGDDRRVGSYLFGSAVRCVFAETKMSSGVMVVISVA